MQRGCPQHQQVRGRKASSTRVTSRPPCSSNSPQVVPFSIIRVSGPGWPLLLILIELVGTKAVPAALESTPQKDTDSVYILVPREKMAPVDNELADAV